MKLNSLRAKAGRALVATAIALVCSATGKAQNSRPQHAAGVILGVLEDLPGDYAGQPNFRAVRAMFEWRDGNWAAFPSKARNQSELKLLARLYPQHISWTIVFRGRNLGQVSSQAPAQFDFYGEVGTEKIVSAGQVPTIGRRSEDYSDYGGVPVYRPLVAVSQPNYLDPQHWRRVEPAPKLISSARQLFRERFRHVENCTNPEDDKGHIWSYRDDDIGAGEAYASDDGWRLIELHLRNWRCDGPSEEPFDLNWFVANPAGAIRFLGFDMQFLDAGDYSGTGSSDVLFSAGGENLGGYRLYYQNFARHVDFTFNYH